MHITWISGVKALLEVQRVTVLLKGERSRYVLSEPRKLVRWQTCGVWAWVLIKHSANTGEYKSWKRGCVCVNVCVFIYLFILAFC